MPLATSRERGVVVTKSRQVSVDISKRMLVLVQIYTE